MKKNLNNLKTCGFSLAEALITLLVVAIITLATIPVITKKTKKLDEHGKWMCTLNSAGNHVYWFSKTSSGKSDNPDTWEISSLNGCKFDVPPRARNFAITASAGGGGGAGASAVQKSWTSGFDINEDNYGKYRMLVVGGGGRGGRTNNSDHPGSAGSGAVATLEYNVTEDVVRIDLYKGGAGTGGSYNGSSGGLSKITALVKNKYTGRVDTVTLVEAAQGEGGHGSWRGSDHRERWSWPAYLSGTQRFTRGVSGYREYTVDNTFAGKGEDTAYCNFGYIPYRYQSEINTYMYPFKPFPERYCSSYASSMNEFCQMVGLGGAGQHSRSVCRSRYGHGENGNEGLALVATSFYKSGGGGEAGQSVVNRFYPSFQKRSYIITVGKGGAGGRNQTTSSDYAQDGGEGGKTIVGDLFGLNGGAGGKREHVKGAMKDTPGGDGEKTPLFYKNEPRRAFGGLSGSNSSIDGQSSPGYGAGGGGGGIKQKKALEGDAGKGADGTKGIVIIEW